LSTLDEKLSRVKKLPLIKDLNLSGEILKILVKNGPFLEELISKLENNIKFSYDLIHTTFFPYFNLIISLLIGKANNIPTICTPFFHFANPRYLNLEIGSILSNFDKIISCTNSEKSFLVNHLKIPSEKIRVISMGVDFLKFKENKNPNQFGFKKKYFKPSETKYKMVLFCGYKNYEKGAVSILKAIPKINNEFKKVYFVFIGPSTLAFNRELSKIQKLRYTRVINLTPDNLTGYFDKKKIAAFKETDIFLMPSRSDAFGIAYLEAWASGKPVIGANIGAIPEVINDKVDGLLVQFDNQSDIAKKVVHLLKHKKLRKKYGSNGQEKVGKFYSWDKIASKTHELYQELMGE
jgi:glycosyltransferase involved in cell wall biosynthesis